jgi:hypothetical protein
VIHLRFSFDLVAGLMPQASGETPVPMILSF